MALHFKELDFCATPLGDLMLRWRRSPQLPGVDIYEVKLGEHFLMSSLFHEAETQLSRLGLAELPAYSQGLEVVVGGLGLGYTAVEALADVRVATLVVIEYLEPVIAWHRRRLVPLGKQLCEDARCVLHHADFFECAADPSLGLLPGNPGKPVDAVLLDIDHTPSHLLDASNSSFYSEAGLMQLRQQLNPGGVFALWADGEPEPQFAERLGRVFRSAKSHAISFENPLTGGTSMGAVYVAVR